jgi:hypothetical protein
MKYRITNESWGDAVEVTLEDIQAQAAIFGMRADELAWDDHGVYVIDPGTGMRHETIADAIREAYPGMSFDEIYESAHLQDGIEFADATTGFLGVDLTREEKIERLRRIAARLVLAADTMAQR